VTTIPTIVVTPSTVAQAYGRTAQDLAVGGGEQAAPSFSNAVTQAVQQAVATGEHADTQAIDAIRNGGNLTQVVTALSQAELTLQTATAIRDRVVQAYQDIIRMPI
jgi:flagellar hook-basal body complex protein FliE